MVESFGYKHVHNEALSAMYVLTLHRHTEMFRSCNSKSDYEAKRYMQGWTKGFVHLPNSDIKIPIKDIKKCLPETWKVRNSVVLISSELNSPCGSFVITKWCNTNKGSRHQFP